MLQIIKKFKDYLFEFIFIDLCTGIIGFKLAFGLNSKCNKHAHEEYRANFDRKIS